MKIAVWHNLPSGGGKRALYQHVRGLAQRGHEIESWSLDTADSSYLPLAEFAVEHVRPSEPKHRAPGWLARKFAPNYSELMRQMRAFDEACKKCAREIDDGGFDVLFANSALRYSMPYLVRHVRLPRVLYLQEPNRFLYEAAPDLPWVSGVPDLDQGGRYRPLRFISDYANLQALRFQARQERLNAHACDYLLVNSYFSRESVLRAYGVDARVCYLGVDTTLFRELGLERERFIVGLGSFDSIKGIDLAIKAVSWLAEPRPPLVWIANSGNETYQLRMIELARSLGVDLRIKMAVTDAALVEILNRATLLLYTSKLEPFGFAPLEANACGLPVVGVAEGGVRETIEDGLNGFLVNPEPECLARAAERLLQNPELAQRMGVNAVAHVQQHWSSEQSVDRLEAFLVKVVSGGER